MSENKNNELNQQELEQVVGGNSARHTPVLIDQKSWERKRAADALQDNDEQRRQGQLDSERR